MNLLILLILLALTRLNNSALTNITELAHGLDSQTQKIDFARGFVYAHSVHLIDVEHDRYAWDTSLVLSKLWQNYYSQDAPPHLSCGPRALAMHAILAALGIPSRLVYVYTDNYDELRSHTFLEVYNGDTGRWEAQDPDFNIYYRRGHERVAARDLLLSAETALPCSADVCGWTANGVEHLRKDYFEILVFDRPFESDLLLSTRFSLEKKFPRNNGQTIIDLLRPRRYEFVDQHVD